jgi:polyhydroxybutyrate depolymerase
MMQMLPGTPVRRIAAVAVASLAAAGFGPVARAQVAPVNAQVRELTSGGTVRTYRVVHPASAPAHPALVMMLHGGFGSGAQAESAYGWDAAAAAHGFVVVYPDGLAHAWNAGRCCGAPYAQKVGDVAFLTAVIRDAEQRDGVDPDRVYVTGMSNGAIMAYRLACEAPVAIAAIGPVAGDLEVPCRAPHGPVSVLAIHGTADRNVPIAGGFNTAGATHTDHASLADSLARWREIDRCGAPSVTRRPPLTTETARCAGGAEVGAITIDGAGHQWPGGKPSRLAALGVLGLDQPSRALDATAVLWEFFNRPPQGPSDPVLRP